MSYSFLRMSPAFHANIFEDFDLEYNLDYYDSTGTRHQQTLADIYYADSDVPNLIAASLAYLPSDVSNFDTDRFRGIVTCEIPRVGTRHLRNAESIVSLLARKLQPNLQLKCQIDPEGNTLIVDDVYAKTKIEFKVNVSPDDRQVSLELILPTDHRLTNAERYEDTRLAVDLWTFLHDFAANLSIDMNYHSASLGRFAFSMSNPIQTLHVGVPRAQDFCRFGMAILQAQDTLFQLIPDEVSRSQDLDYAKWDRQLAPADDTTLASITRRAITLARNGELTNDLIDIAIKTESSLKSL